MVVGFTHKFRVDKFERIIHKLNPSNELLQTIDYRVCHLTNHPLVISTYQLIRSETWELRHSPNKCFMVTAPMM